MLALRLIGSVGAVVFTLQLVEFVWAYHRQTRGDWRLTEAGKNVMFLSVALLALMLLSMVRIVVADVLRLWEPVRITDPAWFLGLRVLAFWALLLWLAHRRWMLHRAQLGEDRNAARADEQPDHDQNNAD